MIPASVDLPARHLGCLAAPTVCFTRKERPERCELFPQFVPFPCPCVCLWFVRLVCLLLPLFRILSPSPTRRGFPQCKLAWPGFVPSSSLSHHSALHASDTHMPRHYESFPAAASSTSPEPSCFLPVCCGLVPCLFQPSPACHSFLLHNLGPAPELSLDSRLVVQQPARAVAHLQPSCQAPSCCSWPLFLPCRVPTMQPSLQLVVGVQMQNAVGFALSPSLICSCFYFAPSVAPPLPPVCTHTWCPSPPLGICQAVG